MVDVIYYLPFEAQLINGPILTVIVKQSQDRNDAEGSHEERDHTVYQTDSHVRGEIFFL